MNELFPIIDDPFIINKKLLTEPILTGILNKNLGLHQRSRLYPDFYIVEMEFRGEDRLGMLLGFYKRKQPKPTKEEEQYYDEFGGIFEKLLLEPFTCILLKDMRSESLRSMSKLFDVDVIRYENRDRFVMLCNYYREPARHLIKPKIIEQKWRFTNAKPL